MKTVRLFGELGKKFGNVHRFDVRTPAEAVRALNANFPLFQKELQNSSDRNVAYQVKVDDREIDEKELSHPVSREIHIIPMIMGAGSSGAKLIIGAVLIVAGLIVTGGTYGAGAPFGTLMINVGIGFMIGGVSQMLTPVPHAPDPAEEAKNKPNYVFSGPVNTTAQGQPVPIGYGRVMIGSAVISAGIVVQDASSVDPLFNPASINFQK